MSETKTIVMDKQKRIDFIMMQWHRSFAPTRNWTEEERNKMLEISRTLVDDLHNNEQDSYEAIVKKTTEEKLKPLIQEVMSRILKDMDNELAQKVFKESENLSDEEFQKRLKECIHKSISELIFMNTDRKIIATKLEGGGLAFSWESDRQNNNE